MRLALNGRPQINTYHGEAGYGYFGKHAGFDYNAVNQPVFAPESGTIINVYPNTPDGGNIIELQGGYTHRFLHLSQIQVSKGQNVSEGQQIGVSGATGKVTGAHLHTDTRKNGTTWNQSYNNYVDWEIIVKGQGDVMNTQSGIELYRTALFREPENTGVAGQWNGQAPEQALRAVRGAEWQSIKARLEAYSKLEKAVSDLQTALANEKNRPPEKVIEIIEKIVEKPVEVIKTVEVVKEVPVERFPSWIPVWLKQVLEVIFKKG